MSRSLNILLIDDDNDTQRLFRMVAEHSEHELVIAQDGHEGLELLKASEPDIVVIDLFLPGLDGYQVFDRIVQDDLAPYASLVATTAYHSSDTYHTVMTRGFVGLLSKPLQLTELMNQLEQFANEN